MNFHMIPSSQSQLLMFPTIATEEAPLGLVSCVAAIRLVPLGTNNWVHKILFQTQPLISKYLIRTHTI